MKSALTYLWLMLAATPVHAETLNVFAAASLKGPLDTVADGFEDVAISYAGSGTVARQVAAGAPADVVLLANVAWMDDLVARGVIDPAGVTDFASNALVLVGQRGAKPIQLTPKAFATALGREAAGGRLAIGNTRSVPAGLYGRAALEHIGLWEVAAPRLAETQSVRAALALATRGEVPLALVYQSDARLVPHLPVVARIPAASHPAIRYQGAVASNHPQAGDFLQAVVASRDVFAQAGFCPVKGCTR